MKNNEIFKNKTQFRAKKLVPETPNTKPRNNLEDKFFQSDGKKKSESTIENVLGYKKMTPGKTFSSKMADIRNEENPQANGQEKADRKVRLLSDPSVEQWLLYTSGQRTS